MQKLIDRIQCTDDDGTPYIVEKWQDQIPAGHMDDPNATIPGMNRLKLSSGGKVNFRDENTFEVVQTGVVLRRV
jgi:hypothetical protein